MSRRAALVAQDEVVDQCLLCGGDARTYLDLCNACAGVVQATADRVASWYHARATGLAPAVVQVPGQLELDEENRP